MAVQLMAPMRSVDESKSLNSEEKKMSWRFVIRAHLGRFAEGGS